jgi:hypothetical protein
MALTAKRDDFSKWTGRSENLSIRLPQIAYDSGALDIQRT